MVQTIRIDHLLRETVTTPYRNLVTRGTGAAVRTRIEAALAQSTCRLALLDFSEVDLLDFSCADEIVAKLLRGALLATSCTVVLRGLRDDQREAIAHVLTHQRLAVLAEQADPPSMGVLGWISDDARAAFACLAGAAPLEAEALAARLGWDPVRAAAALDLLARHRLVAWADGAFQSPSLT